MIKAIIPGSFDPVTAGHADLARRSADLFGAAEILVMDNGAKSCTFTLEEREEIARAAFSDDPRITVKAFGGLLSEYVRSQGGVIIKGVRSASDFDYEYSLWEINRALENCETVLLPAKNELSFVSSTFVRELIRYGRPLEPYVPAAAARVIARLLSR